MKRFYLSKLITLIAILSGIGNVVDAQTVTFGYSGGSTYWTCPSGVTSVSVDMSGAKGGTSYGSYSRGGYGGRVVCNLTVTPGVVYQINVGGQGSSQSCCGTVSGGFNGGGTGIYYGAGGGGATDIRVSPYGLGDRLIVAGGGGGGAYNCGGGDPDRGGNGGGTTGENGFSCSSNTSYGGFGGSQVSGGSGGAYPGYSPGTSGTLGNGGIGVSYGAGGGGGYYGGGGGDWTGGGGGSSFPAAAGGLVSNLTHTQGYNTVGNGSLVLVGPTITTSTSALAFGGITVGSTSATQSFTINGVNLCAGPVTLTPPTDFQISTDGGTSWSSTPVTLTYTPPTLPTTTIMVRFVPVSYSSYTSSITITGGCSTTPAIAVTGIGAFPCSGTPSAGAAGATPTSGRGTTPFSVSLTGASTSGGLAYQWQSSSFSTFGFTNITGATSAVYNFTGITTPTYYRCVVSCPFTGGGSSASSSTLISVDMSPSTCVPTCNYFNSNCANNFYVGTSSNPVLFNGAGGTSINDASACSTTSAYADRTSTMGVTLNMGSTYVPTVGGVTGNQCSSQFWIDFNNDGTFQTTESVGGQANFSSTRNSPTITIPSTGVTPGVYRMRIIVSYSAGFAPGNANYPAFPLIPPCPTSTVYYADIRDYTATIQGPACTGVPTPGSITADVAASCASFTSNMLYNVPGITSGLTYQWQRSISGPSTGFTNIAGATSTVLTASVTGTVWYRTNVTCTNSSSSAPSAGFGLAINPSPAAISGNPTVCIGAPSTFTTTSTGGTWVSSNPAVATVGLGTGIVTGVAPGATVLSYVLPTGCFSTMNLSVYSGAAAITGSSSVCQASSTALATVTPGGTWSSSNTGLATVGLSTGVVTGVAAGNPTITYTLPTGCSSVLPITVNPIPAPTTGTSNACIGLTTNLSNTTPGGAWYSSNTFQASIGSATGVVTGVAAGTPTMYYTLPTGCSVAYPVTINPNPAALTGTATLCAGTTTTLTAAEAGTFVSGNTSLATVDATTGDVTGVAAGSPVISFTSAATGCYTTMPVMVYPTPAVFAVTGGGGFCPSGAGVHIGLSNSVSGIDYQVLYGGSSVGMPLVHGSTSGLDFGVFTGVGNYTVEATNTITGCVSTMSGSATVSNYVAPTAFNVTGGGSYCAGGAGSEITLDGSVVGVKYQLYNTTSVGLEVAGTGSPISFGNQTAAGTYTVMARDEATLCTSAMTGSADITISLRPSSHNVSAGGRYCAGSAGVPVTLDASTPGVNYHLYYGGTAIDSLLGTGVMLDFGPRTGAGTYTIDGVNISNNCSSNMTGSAVIGINPLPNFANVTGGGSFCTGTTGVHVGLDFSTIGTDYQLSNSLTGVVATLSGSNSGLDFGIMTAPGTYTVLATIVSTGCTRNMSGSATVVENPLPSTFAVTDGGDYCEGGSGVPVGLGGSEAGIRYQLYKGGAPIGAMVNGTSLAITFGLQIATGAYTVKAYNPTTGCSSDMTGGVSVGIQPLPTVYDVTGGGNYCAGGAGSNVYLSNSQIGVTYELWVGSLMVSTLTGSGASLDFGPQTVAGTYRVVATNATTPCTRNMRGTVNIGINPLPAAYNVTGGGQICVGGTGLNIRMNPSNTGITYQLKMGGSSVGAALGGTGYPIDFGIHSTAGTYTVEATNNVTGCTNTMTGAAVIVVNPLPEVFTVSGGGIYCEGTGGLPVSLDSSVTGYTYQLWNGSTRVGAPMAGSGPLSFGAQTATGVYTVKATDPVTTCTSTMAGSANIIMNAAPTVYTVSGGGSYCAGSTGVHINLGGSNLGGITYQLYKDGVSFGSFYAGTGLPLDFGAFTAAGVYKVVATNSSTLCTSNMNDSVTVVITPNVTPAVTVNSSIGTTVCNGNRASYNATAVNGGSSPRYEWKVNGASVGFGDTYSYAPVNGDSVSVTLTSSERCTSPATATGSVIMNVNANVMPTVAVSVNTGTTVCPGISSTFTAAPTYGGTAPTYTWMKNGTTVGSTAGTYTTTVNDSDVIFCTMESNYACRTSNFVLSNNVVMTVDAPIAPTFTLSANPGTTTIASHEVTFTANITNGTATTATYQWSINGAAVAGATNATFTTNALANYDVVKCCVTNHNTCGASASVCETQTMVVNSNVGVSTVTGASDIRIMPNPNKGTFTVKGSMNTTADQDVVMEVTNMLGQVVYTAKVAAHNGSINEQIQMNSSLANGMYILNLRSGSDIAVFHFVIEQ